MHAFHASSETARGRVGTGFHYATAAWFRQVRFHDALPLLRADHIVRFPDDVGRRRDDAPDVGGEFFPGHWKNISAALFGVGPEFGIVHHGLERLAQDCDRLRRHARAVPRRNDRRLTTRPGI